MVTSAGVVGRCRTLFGGGWQRWRAFGGRPNLSDSRTPADHSPPSPSAPLVILACRLAAGESPPDAGRHPTPTPPPLFFCAASAGGGRLRVGGPRRIISVCPARVREGVRGREGGHQHRIGGRRTTKEWRTRRGVCARLPASASGSAIARHPALTLALQTTPDCAADAELSQSLTPVTIGRAARSHGHGLLTEWSDESAAPAACPGRGGEGLVQQGERWWYAWLLVTLGWLFGAGWQV